MHILLDIDSTDDPTHGQQEGTAYHAYYGQHMYHPLLLFDDATDQLITALLRPGTAHASRGVVSELRVLVPALRARWPGVQIELRADSGCAVPALYTFCERERIGYTIRLSTNSRLEALAAPLLAQAQAQQQVATGAKVRLVDEASYQAASWRRSPHGDHPHCRDVGRSTPGGDARPPHGRPPRQAFDAERLVRCGGAVGHSTRLAASGAVHGWARPPHGSAESRRRSERRARGERVERLGHDEAFTVGGVSLCPDSRQSDSIGTHAGSTMIKTRHVAPVVIVQHIVARPTCVKSAPSLPVDRLWAQRYARPMPL